MADPKENAEHVMLVDLARNDLSRHCTDVRVDVFREVQFYSHVVHLVSKVSGQLRRTEDVIHILGDTFPAGTLTGAPKYRAMQLLDQYEPHRRGFYGGAIGVIGSQGQCVHAIMIRTFYSAQHTLHYQAGGGVVAYSDEQAEVQEVASKLGALRRAITAAEEIRL
jgi:anthranilate synthase component 1